MFIGDMLYMMTDALGMGVTWMKSEMPPGSWEQMNQIGPQIEVLEAAKVKVKGSEVVGGVDCYVMEVTPDDIEQLWEIAKQQTGVAGGLPDIDEELVKEMLRNFSFKQWIAKDTYFLTKVEMEMDMELTPEAMGIPFAEGEINMDMVMTMLMYDYNQPVSIELPPEAEEAVEMPLGF